MRTQDDNPLYKIYKHLLTTDGLYPSRFVDVHWNLDDEGRVKDVEVVFIPRSEMPAPAENRAVWDVYSTYIKRWESDLPCRDDETDSPESIFGYLLSKGFVNYKEIKIAVKEFAAIEGCDWADEVAKKKFSNESELKEFIEHSARARNGTWAGKVIKGYE